MSVHQSLIFVQHDSAVFLQSFCVKFNISNKIE